jgi:threonine/homoserine/homoserine lactone efflux protein
VAGYGIAVPVGAIAILILETALRRGFRIGFAAGAGAATADFLYATLAAGAGAALSAQLKPLAGWLGLMGGLVLIAIGAYGLWRTSRRKTATNPGDIRDLGLGATYRLFVGLTIVNPLTVVYFAALILGRSTGAIDTAWSRALFVLGAGLASLSWQTLLAGLGSIAHRHLSPRAQGILSVAGNLIVVALGIRLLLSV